MRRQQRLLVDHRDPTRGRFGGIAEADRRAPPTDLATVGRNHTGDDLHQRGLTRSVLAHQQVHFPRVHGKIAAPQRRYSSESLLNLVKLEKQDVSLLYAGSLTLAFAGFTLKPMEVHFSPDKEARLQQVAARTGKN